MGISACLAGQEVRFDGASRRFKQRALFESLAELQSFCPEVAIGLGTPRQTLRLVDVGDKVDAGDKVNAGGKSEARPNIEVRQNKGDLELSRPLAEYADAIADRIEAAGDFTGFIVCKGSPSCGMEGVKRYTAEGHMIAQDAQGAFTQRLMERLPWLPIEEDGRLNDRGLRESFLTRIHVMQRWHESMASGVTAAALLSFHRRHKFLLLAHNQPTYRRLGRKLANLSGDKLPAVAADYLCDLMQGLRTVPTHGNHANVLMHLQGYVKAGLSSIERGELSDTILAYRRREVARHAPLALLRHHLMNHPNSYALSQHYFDPFPAELLSVDFS